MKSAFPFCVFESALEQVNDLGVTTELGGLHLTKWMSKFWRLLQAMPEIKEKPVFLKSTEHFVYRSHFGYSMGRKLR